MHRTPSFPFLANDGFTSCTRAEPAPSHRRSSKASSGDDMNSYADDLARNHRDTRPLHDATLVGVFHRQQECSRYIERPRHQTVPARRPRLTVPPLWCRVEREPGRPCEV